MSKSEQIRRAVEQISGAAKRRRYAPELRDRIIAFTAERRAQGADLETIGAELGVPWRTLARWCASARKKERAFRRVNIIEREGSSLTVHGPCGLRIVGEVNAVAELIRRLG